MIKIGIVGSDNSHAVAFSKLVNIKNPVTGEYNFPDMRITHLFGFEKARNEEVAKEGQIENIVEKPEDMIGQVDAVMVVFRHGDLHLQYALPFVQKGIPTWIDKPVTISIADCKALIDAADSKGTLLTGGSTCKYAYDVLMLKNVVETKAAGNVMSGMLNFPATLENEYGGIYFYGGHSAEMVMQIFGYDVQSVVTSVNNGNVTAIAKYPNYDVTLNFTKLAGKYHSIVIGDKTSVVRELDISLVYRLGFEKFAEMLRTGQRPLPLDKLLAPVVLLNALDQSVRTGKEVFLKDLA